MNYFKKDIIEEEAKEIAREITKLKEEFQKIDREFKNIGVKK